MARTARGGRQRVAAHAQRRGRRKAYTSASSSARARQRGTGAAREAATPVGFGSAGTADAERLELASAPLDVRVEFGADGFPIGVGPVRRLPRAGAEVPR